MPECLCCHTPLVQDSEIIKYTNAGPTLPPMAVGRTLRYYYCNAHACLRYRLLVLPPDEEGK